MKGLKLRDQAGRGEGRAGDANTQNKTKDVGKKNNQP